ncbi:MAG: prolyl oligopeptidase family serine peptidase, partial [Myxococcota bacterium]
LLPLDGGEAVAVDTGELEPAAFAWSPDGATLAVPAPIPPTEAEEEAKAATGDVVVWGEPHPDRLWTVPIAGGAPTRVGDADVHVAEIAWSPDGRTIAAIVSPTGDPLEVVLRTVATLAVDTGALTTLVPVPGGATRPEWSPDGAHLAWLGTRDTLTLHNTLNVRAADGSHPLELAHALDPTLGDFAWAGPDAVVATITHRTATELVRIGLDGRSEVVPGIPDHPVLTSLAGGGARFATIAQSPTVPPEPAWLDLAGGRGVAAHPNDVSGWALGAVEVVSWRGPGGATIEGVLTMPPGATGAVPLMVYPHGGPDSVTTLSFDERTRYFAGKGYAVLRPNYRGGTGYGHAFYAANRGKLGALEFGDIEAGVDALIRRGTADAARLVYGGWSWGGYLTAWTIGHTDRYRAAVAGAAVVDVISQYALSDLNHGVAADWEYRGNPWTAPARFARSNPVGSLVHATTPTLIAHGRSDVRVDFSSSVILWRALTDIGCPVELLAFPDEPHGFRDPRHVIHLLDQWTGWYDQHLPAR